MTMTRKCHNIGSLDQINPSHVEDNMKWVCTWVIIMKGSMKESYSGLVVLKSLFSKPDLEFRFRYQF